MVALKRGCTGNADMGLGVWEEWGADVWWWVGGTEGRRGVRLGVRLEGWEVDVWFGGEDQVNVLPAGLGTVREGCDGNSKAALLIRQFVSSNLQLEMQASPQPLVVSTIRVRVPSKRRQTNICKAPTAQALTNMCREDGSRCRRKKKMLL